MRDEPRNIWIAFEQIRIKEVTECNGILERRTDGPCLDNIGERARQRFRIRMEEQHPLTLIDKLVEGSKALIVDGEISKMCTNAKANRTKLVKSARRFRKRLINKWQWHIRKQFEAIREALHNLCAGVIEDTYQVRTNGRVAMPNIG